jgi:hypothetical protein
MARRMIAGALLASVLAVAPARALLNSDLATADLGGGCYPTGITPGLLDMLTLVNPEWAPVMNGMTVDSTPAYVHGQVLDMHGDLSGDFPATHVRADFNADLDVDPADLGTIATGNDNGHAHIEWEAGAFPAWAWPGEGDRMVVLGRLIFDCGHPGAMPGQCTGHFMHQCVLDSDCHPPVCAECFANEFCINEHFGYGSEIHPVYASAAIRRGRGGLLSPSPHSSPVPVTKADVYVSGDGGGAGDRCILTHRALPTDLLSVECFPLSQRVAQVNARDFTFDLPLPPRPPHTQLRFRKILYPAPGGRGARVMIRRRLQDPSPHLEVTVLMTRPVGGLQPTGFAGTILAGWQRDPTPLTHVRTSVTGVVINNALQPATPVAPKTCSIANTPCDTAANCPSGESCFGQGPVKAWQLQTSVNGEWVELGGLGSVSTNDVIPQSIVFDQYLSAGDGVHVVTNGVARECVDALYDKSIATDLANLGFNKGLLCLNSTAHNAGTIDVTYAGPDFGAGLGGTMDYATQSVGGQGGHCSLTTGLLCLVNEDCPSGESCTTTGGAFSLSYRIERLP